jgi:hypothetical protein
VNFREVLRRMVEPDERELARKMIEAEQAVEEAKKTIVYTEEELRTEPSLDLMVVERGKTVVRTVLKRDLGKYDHEEVISCDNCGEVHKTNDTPCRSCGAKLPSHHKTAYKLKPERVLRSSSTEDLRDEHWVTYNTASYSLRAGSVVTMEGPDNYRSMQNTPTAVMGQITIQAGDGDIQIETFKYDPNGKPGDMAEFVNTALNFFVVRKPGRIVDITVPDVEGSINAMTFIVNGRDTGITRLLPGLRATVSSRMPAVLPIAGGAAVQLRMT